jgi:hypothetical protein
MRRLLVLGTVIALLLGVAFIVAKVALVPYAERRAADAIGASLGAPVTVKASDALSPGIVRGDLGTLHVTAPRVQRDGFTVTDFAANVHGASIDVPRLVGGDAVLSFSRITAQAQVRQGTLSRYVRQRLRLAGVPGARHVAVELGKGAVQLATSAGSVPARLVIAGPSSIRVVPTTGSLSGKLSQSIDLGPFPYGLRLSSIRVLPGRVVVSATRGAGSETLS